MKLIGFDFSSLIAAYPEYRHDPLLAALGQADPPFFYGELCIEEWIKRNPAAAKPLFSRLGGNYQATDQLLAIKLHSKMLDDFAEAGSPPALLEIIRELVPTYKDVAESARPAPVRPAVPEWFGLPTTES